MTGCLQKETRANLLCVNVPGMACRQAGINIHTIMVELKNLESMLAQGQDNALLRFALGNAFIKYNKYAEAVEHLARAVEFDPGYSAAWKLYGKALAATGHHAQAINAYEQGVSAAENKGDIQAAREMRVFLNRLKTVGD